MGEDAEYSDNMHPGKMLIAIGLIIVVIGALIVWAPKSLAWFGRLPGDIRIEREGFSFYFPITTMILVSIILSLLSRLFGKG